MCKWIQAVICSSIFWGCADSAFDIIVKSKLGDEHSDSEEEGSHLKEKKILDDSGMAV